LNYTQKDSEKNHEIIFLQNKNLFCNFALDFMLVARVKFWANALNSLFRNQEKFRYQRLSRKSSRLWTGAVCVHLDTRVIFLNRKEVNKQLANRFTSFLCCVKKKKKNVSVNLTELKHKRNKANPAKP